MKHLFAHDVRVILVTLGLAGCSAGVPPPTEVPTATVAPQPTVVAANTPTPLVPFTPRPTLPIATTGATANPMPTQSTSPTPNAALAGRLIEAAEAGNTPLVVDLLAQGAPINAQDGRGRTPVMAATHGNRVDTVRALIGKGADVNIRDARSDNPFLYAGAEGQLEILRLVIAAKPNTKLTNRFGGTPLIPAAERGHVEIIRELLTNTDVNINHVNNLGWTALLEAVILGNGGPRHVETVRLLVNAGADVNLADKDGVTPLQHAVRKGQTEIAAILRAQGAR